ncbi:hypothetical protein AYO45_05080 [Gammaproteobacteria bacterium SCGC AG-212-F23]|nr:hypothetical protein AYO45_05080 [Gammaproteobacteria bacterium SCGC AG-212-F23]
MQNKIIRPQWSSLTNYLLVTTGAVVGLGNIFQFPYFISKFGGLFLLFFILCEVLVSVPILLAELLIGRRGKQNPVGAFSILSMETGASSRWRYVGWISFVILSLTLSFYTVSVAYPLKYFFGAIQTFWMEGSHANLLHAAVPLTDLHLRFTTLEISFMVFLIATMLVILRGINRGLEGISRITVPAYFVILAVLAVLSCLQGEYFVDALKYLFTVRADQSVLTVLFAALTFAFFKLNVGMGSMIVYGSYLPYNVSLGKSTLMIICFDIVASLLSYFVLYPLSLQSHQAMSDIPNYYHNSLSILASSYYGSFIAPLFFLAAVMAAWTPTIAMAESATVILIERFDMTRKKASIIIFLLALLIGTFVVRSYNLWVDVVLVNHMNFQQLLDAFSSNLLTPFAALLTAIFAGWIVKKQITESELGFNVGLYNVWRFLIRVLAPVVIIVVALSLLELI